MINQQVRVRIAPSPTGEDIHIGNLYTALLNFAYAKKHQGKFVVRIEDTDRERLVVGSEERILASLRSYGVLYDEGPDVGGEFGPYRQSDRLDIYKKYVQELIKRKSAYYCFCSKERLDEVRAKKLAAKQIPKYDKYCLTAEKNPEERIAKGDPYVVRLDVPSDRTVAFTDLIRGDITFNSSDIDDQVLLKSDGYPTYHLAVVVDDHLMQISHVVRAEDWIPSTPKHILLFEAFGWDLPVFVHVPLLRNPDRSKLSKRKNPVWAGWYLEQGFLPEAVVNYLTLLGWSHPEERELYPLSEFINLFDLKDIHAVGPIFDLTKLTWMNQQYIQQMDDEKLLEKLLTYDQTLQSVDRQLLQKLIPLAKTRMNTLAEFSELISHVIGNTPFTPETEEERTIASQLHDALTSLEEWNKDTILSVFRETMEKHSIKMSVLYKIFTGKERGLPLPESLEIIGKENALQKLQI